MNILFYTIANKRSRDIESQAISFARDGHNIFLLTQSERSQLHEDFESRNFKAYHSIPVKAIFPVYLMLEVAKLVWFCYRHQITVVHAHLDPCCLVAVRAQFFLIAKVVVTRHHADALRYETTERNQRISRNIYAQAKVVVAVSQNVKQFMVEAEHINEDKITVIPLAYNFELYEIPAEQEVASIREQYASPLLFCTVGRLTGLKRINLAIEFIDRLKKDGIDCKLMIVGVGPEEMTLKQQVERLELRNHVSFVGFSNAVLKYLAAAHYYIHFSITEASCTTVKEAGIVGTPVIVCDGVGDFDQYVENNKNGYIVSKVNPVTEAITLIQRIMGNEPERLKVGENLRKTVLSFFAIERAMPAYKALHTKILNK